MDGLICPCEIQCKTWMGGECVVCFPLFFFWLSMPCALHCPLILVVGNSRQRPRSSHPAQPVPGMHDNFINPGHFFLGSIGMLSTSLVDFVYFWGSIFDLPLVPLGKQTGLRSSYCVSL